MAKSAEVELHPLYLASPPAKEVTDELVHRTALAMHNSRKKDFWWMEWEDSPQDYKAKSLDMVRAGLKEALRNRTPDDEVGNG